MSKKPLKKVIKTDKNTIKGIYNLARMLAVRYLNKHPSTLVEIDDLAQSGMLAYLDGQSIIFGIIQGYRDASPLKRTQCGQIPFPRYQEIEENTLDSEADFDSVALLSQVWDTIDQLDSRTADIMHRRFKQGQTLQYIGEQHSLSESRIGQIVDKTLIILRRRLQ